MSGSTTPINPAYLIAAAVVVLGGITYWRFWARKKRREALAALAFELRMEFSPDGDETLFSTLKDFHLFSHGHSRSRRLTNLMRGAVKGGNAAVFDYQYRVGGGKEQHTRRYTVLCLDPGGRPLPRFFLRPEQLFDKIGAWLGHKDIAFEMHPEFSKKYMLRGEDEMEIRRLFTDRVIAFFERSPSICVEGGEGHLLVYRQRGHLKPEEIQPFIEMGVELVSLMKP